MDNWLDIPEDHRRQPVGRLCLMMALTVLVLMAHSGRKSSTAIQTGVAAAAYSAVQHS